MNTLRVGVAGGGWIAESIVPAIQATGATVIGLADPDPRRRQRWQTTCPVAESLQAVLATGPDVVFILTPTATHADLATAALAAGAHVVIEKPLATDPAACDRIIAAAQAAGLHALVEESYLSMPSHRAAFDALADGRIGTVQTILFTFHGWRPRPEHASAVDAANTSGWRVSEPFAWVRDHGVHLVALSRRLAGAATVERIHPLGGPTEDRLRGATWRSGSVDVVWVRATRGTEGVLGAPSGLHTRIIGSDGWLDVLGEGGRWADAGPADALRFADGTTIAVPGPADRLWDADTCYYPAAHNLSVSSVLAHIEGETVEAYQALTARDDVATVEALIARAAASS